MNIPSKYKLLIFDLDDTLFDYQSTEIHSIKSACTEHGIPYIENNTYILYKRANSIAKSLYSKLITENDFNHFRMKRATLFLNSVGFKDIEPFSFVKSQLMYSEIGILIDDVYPTFQKMSKGIKKVVGTNGSNYPRENKIRNSNINIYIDGFYSSETIGVQKPDPYFFKKIISQCDGISDNEVLVVGNNLETDIMGAFHANINSCLFNHSKAIITDIPSDVVIIEKFSDLLSII